MGAFALIALFAGGPLGVCFALAYGVVSLVKITKVDAEYAKRGEVPPTTRLIEKWLDARKAKGLAPANAKPAKYGMWRYAWQRWQAMWETAADEHRIRHAADKKTRQELADKGLPLPVKAGARDRAKTSWQWVVDKVISPVGEKQAGPGQPAPVPTPITPDVPDSPRTACEDCGQTLTKRGGMWTHPSSSGCPIKLTPTRTAVTGEVQPGNRTSRPDDESAAPAATDHATEGDAMIVDTDGEDMNTYQGSAEYEIFSNAPGLQDALKKKHGDLPTKTTTGGSTMTQTTQQSGEVVGLMSAINYAGAVAAAHEAHSSGGGETYMASLAQAEVGPETLQSGAAAQEASANAAGAWRQHEKKLQEQLAAKEAVTSETGKKEFLLAE